MRRTLIVSRHDYRTGWRANMHFIADAYRQLGDHVSFVSIGFSPLSSFTQDHRIPLSSVSNRWETVDGIDCYLWKSPLHPFGKGLGPAKFLTNVLFEWWINSSCGPLDESARAADLIIIESGIGAALVGRLRKAAPGAKIHYLASDLLTTIGAHPFIAKQLFNDREKLDAVVVVARAMASDFKRFGRPIAYVPHGLDTTGFSDALPTPYTNTRNVVTVGSMLFDEEVLLAASKAFPDIDFHLIGTPPVASAPKNLLHHGRMPFKDTLPYLKHADVGVAPYHYKPDAQYLSDSSMKLMQYGYFALPAVCPDFAAGDYPGRFGYSASDIQTVIPAFEKAFEAKGKLAPTVPMTWCEVAKRLADPQDYLCGEL